MAFMITSYPPSSLMPLVLKFAWQPLPFQSPQSQKYNFCYTKLFSKDICVSFWRILCAENKRKSRFSAKRWKRFLCKNYPRLLKCPSHLQGNKNCLLKFPPKTFEKKNKFSKISCSKSFWKKLFPLLEIVIFLTGGRGSNFQRGEGQKVGWGGAKKTIFTNYSTKYS